MCGVHRLSLILPVFHNLGLLLHLSAHAKVSNEHGFYAKTYDAISFFSVFF